MASTRKTMTLESKLARGQMVRAGLPSPSEAANTLWQKNGVHKVRFHRNVWYRWTGTHFEPWHDVDLKASCTRFLEGTARDIASALRRDLSGEWSELITESKVTVNDVNNLINALAAICIVPSEVELPAWIDTKDNPGPVLSFRNGLVKETQLIDGGRVDILPHDAHYFCTSSLPFDYVHDATCPKWESFLNEILDKDTERIRLLQQWFGYVVGSSAEQQQFLLMVGKGANGKSVVADVLIGIIGSDNVSTLPLETLDGRFSLLGMYQKKLNVSHEANAVTPRTEAVLKQLVGGDVTTTDRKFKDLLQWRPTTKLLVLSNDRPRFADKSDGIWRRLMILPFNVVVPRERQIPHLGQQLLIEEASGILRWAVTGLRELRATGRFVEPALSRKYIDIAREEDDALAEFVRATWESDRDASVTCAEAFMTYESWAMANGEKPVSSSDFGRQLRRIYPSIDRRSGRVDGKVVNSYKGIRRRPNVTPE